MTRDKMVEEFICPGCVGGMDTKCGRYAPGAQEGCSSHVLGTSMLSPHHITLSLGLPRGFNRGGRCLDHDRYHAKMTIRVWPKGEKPPEYDDYNIPVWCMVEEGFLFVRVCHPRMGDTSVDVIEGGVPEVHAKGAINMTNRQEEYD